MLLILFATAPLVVAQVDDQEKAEQAAAKQKELEQKTLKLLDDLIGGAYSLKLGENRSYVLVNAADLLWPHDEKRARTLFWEALNALNLPTYQEPAKTTEDSSKSAHTAPTKEQQEEINKYYARLNLRSSFLNKVARHDPQLALEMMRATRQGPPPFPPGNRYDPDISLEDELTLAAAGNDPKRSLQLARDILAKHLNFQVLNLLRDLNQRDQDAATQLAGDIIAKLKTENVNDSTSFAANMAVTLLQLSRTSGALLIATRDMEFPGAFTRLKLDDHQKQDLVLVITDAALSATVSGSILQTIQGVMPEIEQYAPERVARLKALVAEYNRTLPASLRDWNNFNARFEKSTPEEMIKAANEVPDGERAALFHEAAAKAVASGESDRYRELLDKLEDDTQRKTALDVLNNEQMFDDLAHGKTDDLEKLLPLIRAKEQRAMAMAQAAVLLEKKDQHDAAVKLLDQARELVKVNLTDDAQSNALLAVMLGYALVDPPKAFAMIEPVVDRINDDIAKLLLVEKVVKSGATKGGEIILNQPQFPLDLRMMQYAPGVNALARADFDRTKSLADRFQRNELKVAARLMLLRALMREAGSRAN
jgi:hypothetical protein